MVRRPLSPCAAPGCPVLVRPGSRGRCPAHQLPNRWGQGNRGNRRSSDMRALVLREEPVCRYCGREPSVQVDHILALAEGGSSDRTNLAGSCFDCHEEKTQSESLRAKVTR